MSLSIFIKSNELEIEECICLSCNYKHNNSFYPEIECFNITHNLINMAEACGLYEVVWRPDENDIKTCQQMIEHLKNGIKLLKSDPEKFKKYEPENGWGSYKGFLSFLEKYLECCEMYPDFLIKVER
jgi:hypothetical protein